MTWFRWLTTRPRRQPSWGRGQHCMRTRTRPRPGATRPRTKILASRPCWPRGFNVTGIISLQMMKPCMDERRSVSTDSSGGVWWGAGQKPAPVWQMYELNISAAFGESITSRFKNLTSRCHCTYIFPHNVQCTYNMRTLFYHTLTVRWPHYITKQGSPAVADKPARRESMPKLLLFDVLATLSLTGLSSFV